MRRLPGFSQGYGIMKNGTPIFVRLISADCRLNGIDKTGKMEWGDLIGTNVFLVLIGHAIHFRYITIKHPKNFRYTIS